MKSDTQGDQPSLKMQSRPREEEQTAEGPAWWFVVCPLCRDPFMLNETLLRIDPKRPEEIRLQCPLCEGLHPNATRRSICREGFWSTPEKAQGLAREFVAKPGPPVPAPPIAAPIAKPARAKTAVKPAAQIRPPARKGWVNSWK